MKNNFLKSAFLALIPLTATTFYAHNNYSQIRESHTITMGISDSLTITLNCYQKVADKYQGGTIHEMPHIWRLDGLQCQSIVTLSNETVLSQNNAPRAKYDSVHGYKKYSLGNTLDSLMLMPVFFLGALTLTPYEQEYLFCAATTGTTQLSFICEQRYCWEPPTKIVDVTINVSTTKKTKKHTLTIK